MWAIDEPRGPMENGTTYMVRPRIDPRNRSVSSLRMVSGSRQLLVGPASDSSFEQMKVRASHHSTASGSHRAAISSTHATSFLFSVGGMGVLLLLGVPVRSDRGTDTL